MVKPTVRAARATKLMVMFPSYNKSDGVWSSLEEVVVIIMIMLELTHLKGQSSQLLVPCARTGSGRARIAFEGFPFELIHHQGLQLPTHVSCNLN